MLHLITLSVKYIQVFCVTRKIFQIQTIKTNYLNQHNHQIGGEPLWGFVKCFNNFFKVKHFTKNFIVNRKHFQV